MSMIEPNINQLLDKTDQDAFLLCTLASKRAHDINDMMRGQRDRAIQLQTAVDIARANNRKPLSIAFEEIANGDVSYDPTSLKDYDSEN
ncbi:MAG: DNA-directed RNA polymerase subunit omega [Eggerthellaceae bacterium]|jgi:DNA-directed RNA polymerase subunit omega